MMDSATVTHIVPVYLSAINVATFLTYGLDKWKAKHSHRRIRETALLMLAVVGGSVGAWLGKAVWRHKTRHAKFCYGIPAILILQVALVLLVSCKTGKETTHPVGVIAQASEAAPEHSPTVFLVQYDPETGKEPLLEAIKKYEATIVYDYNMMPGMALKKPEHKTLEETMEYFRTVKGVINVEYDHIIRLTDPVKPRLEIK